jgi:DNA-binding Lrp family transcriptional regulator
MLHTADWIDELSNKYRLSEQAVKEDTEKALSAVLTKRLGFEVEAVFNGNFELWGYKERYGDIRTMQIMPEKIKKGLMREIKYSIANALLIRSVMEDYELHKHKMKTVVYGTIIRQKSDDGFVYVYIQDIESRNNNVAAVMDWAHQTPKERGRYMEGQTLPFYILNIKPLLLQGIPRLEVNLSRNSKGLTEGLLRKELIDKNLDIKVSCTRRLAGAFSEIEASERIPRECIKKASDELKERVIVKW